MNRIHPKLSNYIHFPSWYILDWKRCGILKVRWHLIPWLDISWAEEAMWLIRS